MKIPIEPVSEEALNRFANRVTSDLDGRNIALELIHARAEITRLSALVEDLPKWKEGFVKHFFGGWYQEFMHSTFGRSRLEDAHIYKQYKNKDESIIPVRYIDRTVQLLKSDTKPNKLCHKNNSRER